MHIFVHTHTHTHARTHTHTHTHAHTHTHIQRILKSLCTCMFIRNHIWGVLGAIQLLRRLQYWLQRLIVFLRLRQFEHSVSALLYHTVCIFLTIVLCICKCTAVFAYILHRKLHGMKPFSRMTLQVLILLGMRTYSDMHNLRHDRLKYGF